MKTARIGVLGAGVIARRRVRAQARFPDVRVCAITDVRADRVPPPKDGSAHPGTRR